MAIARGRFVRQWGEADQRLAAADEIEHLMESWLAGSPRAVPVSSQGVTDDRHRHVWKTRLMPDTAATAVGAVIVRLQIFRTPTDPTPLGQVDFLLHDTRGRP